MKSIYSIINETNEISSVYTVVGPDESIVSVWPTEEEAKKDCEKMNKEVKGTNIFVVKKDKASEFIKS